ncbi:hypothetical protein QJS10_CPB04g01703 [Acorus calamus]|uniref:SHSP domain-containing protein n=1 Tax=Acorus calamus TaxID=4465 RepID=A0AAV9EZM9_ACOCL|nr:hypothetical protein QJS10_CPB04g01703 [Acorus calamus]
MSSALSHLNGFSIHEGKKRPLYGFPIQVTPPPVLRTIGYTRNTKNNNSYKSLIRVEGREGQEPPSQKVQRQQPNQHQPRRRVAQVAPIGLWDRFPTARTIQQMIETMERVMEDPLAYGNGASLSGTEDMGTTTAYQRGRTPWEIKEWEGEYKMRFDMPGITKKDVKVWVAEKMLVVKAEKEGGGDEEDEWPTKSYGRYNSRIALPENVEVEKIKAEVKDGVLYITIPKVGLAAKVFDIDVQ